MCLYAGPTLQGCVRPVCFGWGDGGGKGGECVCVYVYGLYDRLYCGWPEYRSLGCSGVLTANLFMSGLYVYVCLCEVCV